MTETERATATRLRKLAEPKGLTVTLGRHRRGPKEGQLGYRVRRLVAGPYGSTPAGPAIHTGYLTAKNAERAIAAHDPRNAPPIAPRADTAVAALFAAD